MYAHCWKTDLGPLTGFAICVQGGNLISLKRRGSGGGVGRGPAAAGDWEQWPEEAAAGSPAGGQGNEDDDMQRAIAASLADPDQGGCCCCIMLDITPLRV